MNRMILGLAPILVALSLGCGKDKPEPTAANSPGPSNAASAAPPEPGLKELVVKDVKVGKGPAAATGDLLLVTYKGTLQDGTVFDTNQTDDKAPFAVVLGEGSVIPGWEQGLKGMKVGGERELKIPYRLAYGEAGRPPSIPARADLNFNVKLLDMVRKGEESIYDAEDEKIGTGRAAKKGDTITIRYEGQLVNGKVFDSTDQHPEKAFTFQVGMGTVVPGFDAGILGNGQDVKPMRVGGVRRLRLPPRIAYGEAGQGDIPARSVLRFRIELVSIK